MTDATTPETEEVTPTAPEAAPETEEITHTLPFGYKAVPDFPDYMMDEKYVIRRVDTREKAEIVRKGKNWMAVLYKDGEPFLRGTKKLRRDLFGA